MSLTLNMLIAAALSFALTSATAHAQAPASTPQQAAMVDELARAERRTFELHRQREQHYGAAEITW